MDIVPYHYHLLNLCPNSRIAPREADVEFRGLEMVFNRNGDFLWPFGIGMARRSPRLHNRTKLHASRTSPLLRLRPPQELPELRLVRARSNRLDDNVPRRSPQEQSPPEGLPIPNRRPSRRHDLASQDPSSESPGVVVPRRDVLRSDEGERVQPLHPRDAVRTAAGRGGEGEGGEPPATVAADVEVAAGAVARRRRRRRRADSVEIEAAGVV